MHGPQHLVLASGGVDLSPPRLISIQRYGAGEEGHAIQAVQERTRARLVQAEAVMGTHRLI